MFNIFFLQKITPPYWTPALEEFPILLKEGFLDVTLQHGWEFTHHFSEQNSHFLRKNERMSDSLNKMSDLLIFGEWHKQIAYDRSFLGATWEICSQSLFCHEWPEQLAHIALSKRGNERISSFFYYNFFKYKIFLTLFKFFWVNWRNCSFFVRERATWANFWVSVWFWFPLKASSILHSKVEEYYLDAASLATVISVPVDCEPLMKKQKQEPNHSEGLFFTCYYSR